MFAHRTPSDVTRPTGLSRMVARLRRPAALATAVLSTLSTAAVADEPLVTIEGGVVPENPQVYEWTVTNNHSSPVVFIHFPQYHADTFTPPAGWSNEWKNRFMAGGKDAPGWVRTSVASVANGIATGRAARFTLRLARAGALARPGQVTVRFADGSEVTIANVELPSAAPFLERNAMAIGLAIIFVIALWVHFRRRRKAQPVAEPPFLEPDAAD